MFASLDILNLEWPTSDRDLHITTPILVYLQKKNHLNFKTKSIFNAYFYLLLYRPKMLLLSNFVGANINFDVAELSKTLGIPIVSLISEGNFKEDELDLYLYGKDNINNTKNIVVDKYLLWNKRSKDLIVKKYNDLNSKLVVTGATGFDRYKLLKYIEKNQFLIDNKLPYKKIIGIAGWAFGLFFNENKEYYTGIYGEEQVIMHQNDLIALNKIYKKLIIKNPDILFILRYHPATDTLEEDEFSELSQYQNVFISDVYTNSHYGISDLINISDLWIGYETTTALEAWLLNKQTFLINPTKSNFIRENVHKGSPIVKNAAEAQAIINEYFNFNTIKQFESLQLLRDEIIADVIEHGDGKNYIRAAKEVLKVLNEPDKAVKYSLKIYVKAFKQILKIILSKTVYKKRWPELNYKSNFADHYYKMYDQAICD